MSTHSPVQSLSGAELRESQTLSTHWVSVPTLPQPTHPMASNIKSAGPQSRHVSALLLFPANFPLVPPGWAPPMSLIISGWEDLIREIYTNCSGPSKGVLAVSRALSPCGGCHLFLTSSAAYDFHTEKSINSSSKDWFWEQIRSQGHRSSWKSLDMQIQATVLETILWLCIFGGTSVLVLHIKQCLKKALWN